MKRERHYEYVVDGGLPRQRALTHELGESLEALGAIGRRRQLRRAPEYQQRVGEIQQVLRGFEWDLTRSASPRHPERLRAVAWNVERGKRFEALREALEGIGALDADLLLLTEVDIGTGRVGNRNVPKALAEALGMNYVFANQHLLLSPGDRGELEHGVENTLGLHGCALLSRWPIRRFSAVALTEYTDKFHALEKRLGTKRALLAEVSVGGEAVVVVVAHLDPFAPPSHRAAQMGQILERLERFRGGIDRVLLGGDLNTNTYDLSTGARLLFGIAHHLTTLGLEQTVAQYMVPDQRFERGVFEHLEGAGLTIEGFNNRERGTHYHDTRDPEVIRKTLDYMPQAVFARLQRLLDPWNGVIPVRLDWFAGRGLRPVGADVVIIDGAPISDHYPLWVEAEL